MIQDGIHQVIVGAIPPKRELSPFVKSCQLLLGKGDALKTGNYNRLKSMDQILKKVERIIWEIDIITD